jgi:hypothetical protein
MARWRYPKVTIADRERQRDLDVRLRQKLGLPPVEQTRYHAKPEDADSDSVRKSNSLVGVAYHPTDWIMRRAR